MTFFCFRLFLGDKKLRVVMKSWQPGLQSERWQWSCKPLLVCTLWCFICFFFLSCWLKYYMDSVFFFQTWNKTLLSLFYKDNKMFLYRCLSVQHMGTQKKRLFFFFTACSLLLFHYISPWVVTCVYQLVRPSADSLAVFLRQSQGHVEQELIQGDVGLRGEVVREHGGDDHQNAVGQELWTKKKKTISMKFILF